LVNSSILKKTFVRSTLISFVARYSDIFIQIVITAILARLLSPEDFGVIAIVTVIVAFFKLLSDVGIGPAIIQDKEITQDDISSIFNITVLIAIFSAIIFYISSGIISNFYDNIEYNKIVHFLSISLFFQIMNIVPRALLRKNKKFGLLGFGQLSANIFSGIISILLALNNFNYFSLVYKSIISSLFQFIFCMLFVTISFKLTLSFKFVKRMFKFSSFQFLFNFINYFSRNLDKLLIGKFIGNVSLGYYEKSYRLMLLPLQTFTQVLSPVLHPLLSDLQNENDRMFTIYLRISRILSLIGFPLTVFMFMNADNVILIMFGPQWHGSIDSFKILSISIGLQMVLSSTGPIFQSAGRTDLLFLSGLLSAILTISGTLYGIFFKSIHIVSIALVIAFSINFIQAHIILVKFVLKKKLTVFFKNLFYPIVISIITFIILYFSNNMFSFDKILIDFIINVVLFLFIYVLLLILTREYKIVISIFR
jgi:polysaccharide transporter, PST family